ncbi:MULTISPECIES: transcription-repair coupling factor [Alistipes]|jgi:transcription-repair coupling factor (superfamily II helicase)|uniref:transcription-repair coupling factor n=1 Tax=Alistipes TaxID=239759 RepID=UPI00033D1F7A|nr:MULTISPECIES: transcription-repair coupling factor [Alistipes]MDR3834186.1 transcription-repair coupling factor [Alistipes sp.]MDR3940563.1 transcription-repair coupling factor [Alistipes sp.]RGH18139.1 transcription-repair coupling factor [Alistipes sp. AF14-19]CCZ97596.1 transcription-repair coupling factor (Mfd) [Alistipes sp. CAG:53]
MATAREQLAQFAAGSKALGRLCREYKNRSATVHLEELVGGALSFYAAAAVAESGGVHVFVAEDRDAAAYLLNDFYNLLDERQVYFFPSSWKRSAAYGAEDAQGVVQRTATMHAVRNFTGKGYLVVCTCPEALAERVADAEALQRETITVRVGDRISIEVLEQALVDASFTRVDFVYEPGQYSVRGGIVDVFSYSESKPYRLDFFGDEVDSIRRFNISSQLSSDRLERVEIIPDLNAGTPAAAKVSFARFAGAEASWWFYDADFVLRRVNDIRRRTLSDMEHPDEIDSLLTSRNSLVADLSGSRIFLLRDNLPERPAAATVKFATSPQPKFNKNFEMLADDMIRGALRGYDTYILSENKAQVERLENIFHQIGRGQAVVRSLSTTLHEGFVDNDLKLCLYTDHQIFDRYQRYRINGEIRRDEQMTVAELNQLRPGDYVVHIDHGVGRFDGLVKIAAGDGRMQEAIKLVYKDGDVLFVNVHSLHRISRYKSGDGEPPKVYKLGNGAWQKLKNATKKAVKDISRELIALYAKRKASKGYAFSHDSYLQHELEASFRWEDTPDQQSATAAIKKDMESDQPMDRLVCGDVGFGKTEVAIRAAFKAAVDGKQVAVLVPTTILALQHYRSFTERLRDFPVRVEYINRTKSTKEVSQIREDLASGKIDILIGTHKMLGKQIVFRDLGLLIIDEEQKFGVAAKEKLTEMSVSVDTLTLTATPIPRTLQFSLMGSRDLSVISTPPPNRQPILTESHVFSEEIIRDAVEAELARGGQVYFVHNRVEDLLALQGLITRLCPKARVAVGHGKMPAEQLEKLIMDFIYGEFDVLVSTTIVENGIDIPNANTIIVDNAQNFGLSDLHQLRGRVGRSNQKGYCYLLSPPDELLSSDARRRLRAIEEFSDLGSGFNIAMQDLDIRGAGNLLGAEQSGFIADIGFETYQKIMNEAVAELRAEGLHVPGLSDGEQEVVEQMRFIDDAHIDIEVEAALPDAYVSQQAERLKLYRELDSTKDEEALQAFESRLADRFGPLPRAAKELLNVVRLRWEAIRLGMERVKVKNGLMIVHFVGEENSPFYKSEAFMTLLQRVTQRPDRFVLKQHNNRLAMTVRNVKDVEDAYKTLQQL